MLCSRSFRLADGTKQELHDSYHSALPFPYFVVDKFLSGDFVGVKRNFWLKLEKNEVLMSLDGNAYKPISDVVGGRFMANAGSGDAGGIANAISLTLKANLK